jgi:chemotaxis protein MotA
MVMALYYDEELNLREIGEVLGVTESRVCQLHSQAVARLRARRLRGRTGRCPWCAGAARPTQERGRGPLIGPPPPAGAMDRISLVGLFLGLAAIVGGQVLEGGHIVLAVPAHGLHDRDRRHARRRDAAKPAAVFMRGHAHGALGLRAAGDPASANASSRSRLEPHRAQGRPAVPGNLDRRGQGPLHAARGCSCWSMAPSRTGCARFWRWRSACGRTRIESQGAAKVWESAGGYAPTIGILGAVMGLIHVMENLSDPSKLGSGIAVAFVATIYGVGAANLMFLPIAKKLLANIVAGHHPARDAGRRPGRHRQRRQSTRP